MQLCLPTTQDLTPLGSIHLLHLNVTIEVPGMEVVQFSNRYSMLIAYNDQKSGKTRNIFVRGSDGQVRHLLM